MKELTKWQKYFINLAKVATIVMVPIAMSVPSVSFTKSFYKNNLIICKT